MPFFKSECKIITSFFIKQGLSKIKSIKTPPLKAKMAVTVINKQLQPF